MDVHKMKVAILSCVLGDFDKLVDPVIQDRFDNDDDSTIEFQRFTDEDFPPIADLPPRFQYRIPKMFGWQMSSGWSPEGFDVIIWLDGSMSFTRSDCVKWFLDQLGDNDMVVFKHPWRKTAKEESDHIEDHLQKGKSYITKRYKNGLHKEQLKVILDTPGYVDNELFASTMFIYRNTPRVRAALTEWWLQTSRYFTVDQIAFAYVLRKHNLKLKVLEDNQYNMPYLTMVSEHK